MPTEDRLWLPPLSPKDQKKLDRLRKDRKKSLIVVGISAAFAGLIILTYIWFSLTWPLWVLISLMLIGLVLFILLIWVGYSFQWTGLKGKTLWDWLTLLGTLAIPIVVVLATIGFGLWQSQGALDQQRATILQTYIDNIQDLLIHDNLLLSSSSDINNPYYDVAVTARARTLTALRGLDSQRKGILLQFLYEANLIGFNEGTQDSKTGKNIWKRHPAIIQLSDADLSETLLESFPFLEGVDLRFTNLGRGHLSGAFLNGANLFGANLEGTDLSYAVLEDTYLGPDLRGVNLVGADLRGANLFGADLSGVDLSGVDLSCSIINEPPDLPNQCTDLTQTIITQQQLDQVKSCKGALLPKGIICHHSS
jgi:uncharacterized protein YjbI with pentapeptide repeats